MLNQFVMIVATIKMVRVGEQGLTAIGHLHDGMGVIYMQ